jgi:hypothetical protein
VIDLDLDGLNTRIASVLLVSAPREHLARIRMVAKFSPSGDTAKHEYDYWDMAGAEVWELPTPAARDDMYRLTHEHWQRTQDIGQARWYKMIVNVQPDGRFTIDFEYKNDYQEGDMLQRG